MIRHSERKAVSWRMRAAMGIRRILFLCDDQQMRDTIADAFMKEQAIDKDRNMRFELYFMQSAAPKSSGWNAPSLPETVYDYAISAGSMQPPVYVNAEHSENWSKDANKPAIETHIRELIARIRTEACEWSAKFN